VVTATGPGGQVRGSSVLLVGQVLALAIGFLVQVLTVRNLTKEDYGAFAWALSVVLLVQSLLPLGLDRANARFLALYDERRDYPRLFGFMAVEAVVILGLGTAAVAATWALTGPIGSVAPSQQAVTLLAVLIVLAPVQAVDIVVVEMFAVFASPWSVFLRRYVLEPLLRLAVVVLLVTGDRGPTFLAAGYVAAAAVGLALYLVLLRRMFRRIGLASHFRPRELVLPWREVVDFCGPMLLTTLVAVATTELAAVVLGQSAGAEQVATFRAVQPFAALNLVALYAFTTLFTPALSRLAARRAGEEMAGLYWQSALWVAVLTFPVVAVTTAFAGPFIAFVLGERYATSGSVLVILSAGYYLNAALGFNGLTVQILGRSRWVLLTSVVTLVCAGIAVAVLAPRYEAVGAAVAVLLTLVVHNVLKQAGLAGLGIGVWNREHATVLASLCAVVLALAAVGTLLDLSLWVALPLVAVVWLVVLRQTRGVLRLADAFPEVRKVPVLRRLLG